MSAGEGPYVTCREVLDFLYLYLDGELPEERRREFERHLGVCPPCREYILEYEAAIRLGRASFAEAADQPVDESTPDELVQAILKARAK